MKEEGHNGQQLGSVPSAEEEHVVDLPGLRCSSCVHGELNSDPTELVKKTDHGLQAEVEVVTDSPACKRVCARWGAGKVEHVHCPASVMQEATWRRQLE